MRFSSRIFECVDPHSASLYLEFLRSHKYVDSASVEYLDNRIHYRLNAPPGELQLAELVVSSGLARCLRPKR